jgi:excisionase family DNA binding protein
MEITSSAPIGLTKQAFSVKEAAGLFEPKVSKVTIYRLIWAGKIKVLDGLGMIRIPRSELERFFNKAVVYTPRKTNRKVKTAAGDSE